MADFSNDLNLALRIRALVEGQDAVVDLGSSFIDLNQRIENLIRGLTAISGSTEGAQREFEYLADVAQKYGLKILDLSDNYVKLIASSKGTALEGEAVKKVFESVSGAMSVLGGDTITTHRAFNALSQMMSKGQIYSEELKGQLAEAIPGALGIMSRALDISTADLLALMEAGALGSEVLLPFADQLSQEFGNLATTGRTFTQAVNDLKNTWALLMKRLEDSSGAFAGLTSGIELLSKSSGVLAGVVGAGLAVALQKSIAAIGNMVIATKAGYDSFRLYGTAAQKAAADALAKAAADERAAAATAQAASVQAQAAANTVEQSNLSVAAKEREIAALIAKNATLDSVTAATNASALAESRLLNANAANATAIDNLNAARLRAAAATTAGNVAALESLKISIASEASASANLRAANLSLQAATRRVAIIEQQIIAERQASASGQASAEIEARRAVLVERLNIARERATAATERFALAQQKLAASEAALATAGGQALLAAQKDLVVKEQALAKSNQQVAAAEREVLASRAKVNALIAEGGSVQALATAKQELALIERQRDVLQSRRIAADTAATEAQLRLAAATQANAAAQANLARSQGVLSILWGGLTGPAGLIALMVAGFAAMAYAFREQDEATKSLTKSTDEYAESLKKMGASATVESIRLLEDQRKERERLVDSLKDEFVAREEVAAGMRSGAVDANFLADAEFNVSQAAIKLEKAQSDLAETEAKISNGRSALIYRTADVIDSLERNRFSSDALSEAIRAQRVEIEKLEKQKEAGLAVDRRMDASYKNLARLRKEAATANANLTESQNQYNAAFSDYAKRQKELSLDAEGTTQSLEEQGLTTEQLSARFKQLTKSQLDATNRVNQLKNAITELTARQENLGTSMRAEIELQERLAVATGNTEKQRSAAIAKAQIEQELSIQGVAIAETTLRALEEEIVQKKILLETNPKLEKQTAEQIAKLEAQVIAQKAQVAQRTANAKAATIEAEAARVAGEILSQSLERQRREAAQAQIDLAELRQQYIDMASAGDGMNELLRILQLIRDKEKEIADQASNTELSVNAAFRSLGLNAEEVLTGMDFETRKTIDALKTLAINGELTGVALKQAMDKAIDLADSETEIKAVIKALEAMKLAGVLSSADVNVAISALELKLSSLKASVDPVTRALETLGIDVPEKLAAVAEAARVSFEEIGKGGQTIENVRAAFLEWAEASLAASEASGKLPDPMLKTVAASLGLTTALESLTNAMKRSNPELDKLADRYQNLSRIASDRVSSIEETGRAQLDALQTEADYYRAIGATSVAMQKEQEISRKRIEIAKAVTVAKIAELRAQLAEQGVAAARLEYGKASNALYEQERQSIEAKVAAINAEIEALLRLQELQGQSAKNLAANSDLTERSTDATNEHAEAAQKDAEAADEQSKSYEKMEDKATGAIRELSALSKGMNELLSEMLHVQDVGTLFGNQWSGALGELKLALDQTEGAIRHNLQIIGPYAGQFERSANAANTARKAYLEQAIAATSLTLELTDLNDSVAANTYELERMIFEAEKSKESMGLLDDARLDDLQNAIDAAKDKLRDLSDEALSARQRIEELNAEIAQEKGDTATADRLKLQLEQQQAIADVERDLAEARDAQNTDLIALYETQLAKLDELYRIKEKNLESDIKAQKLAEQQKNTKDKTQDDKPTINTGSTGTAPSGGVTTINNTFLIDPTKLANEEWVKRNVMPTIEKVGRLRA